MRKYFSIIGKSYYWWGTKHGGYGFGEWKFFWWRSMSIHVNLRILCIYFFRQPGKFPPIKLPLVNFPLENSPPRKLPPGIFPPMFLNIPTRVFYFFYYYCHHYHWYYLKDCFVILCFKSAEVFTFVNSCQNEVLSEERQLMKWVGIFQVRIFWVAVFWGGFSRGKFYGWEFLEWALPRGKFS